MDKLIDLLLKNPIILFLIGAWVVGIISNAAKAKQKAAQRRKAEEAKKPKVDTTVRQPLPEQRQAPVAGRREAPPSRAQTAAAPTGPQAVGQQVSTGPGGRQAGAMAQSPDEIAREMRRILGLDPEPAAKPAPAAPRPRPTPPPIEKPPQPVRVSTQDRRLETHVDPHVGERIRDRHMQESQVGKPRAGRGAIGNLGGRVQQRKKVAGRSSRYSLDDLRKAIVINEILSPPVSVRPHEDRHPG